MARKLAAQVVLPGDDGEPVTYPAFSSPPADVAKQITNPSAWLPDDDADSEPAVPVPPAPEPKKAAKRTSKKAADKPAAEGQPPVSPTNDAQPATGGGTPPSQPAPDAPLEEWTAFAAAVGVPVPDGADVDAVKADLTERGLLDQ